MYSMAIVPLYDTLGVEACNFIINQGKSPRAVMHPHPHGLFQYVIVEQACYMYSMAIVPLYDTLGVEACNFIINQGKSLRAVMHPTPPH